MDERRKNKRTNMPSKLVIKRLDGDDDRQVSVVITDVSKGGIGFECTERLQVGEVYEAFLKIWTKEVIHAILIIVRMNQKGEGYSYGTVFVGMPDTESARIEVYQAFEDAKKNQ